MQTRYEWKSMSASSERRITLVKRNVVGESLWSTTEEEGVAVRKLQYELCPTVPSRIVIVETLTQVVPGCEVDESDESDDEGDSCYESSANEEGQGGVSSSESNSEEDQQDGNGDDIAMESIPTRRRSRPMVKSEARIKAEEDFEYEIVGEAVATRRSKEREKEAEEEKRKALLEEVEELAMEAEEAVSKMEAATQEEHDAGEGGGRALRLSHASVASATPTILLPLSLLHLERPALTRVRLLALLGSPGYRSTLNDDNVWVIRLCFDKEKEQKDNMQRFLMGNLTLLKELDGILSFHPLFLRPVEEENGTNSWLIKLDPREPDENLGQEKGYTHLIRDDLLIWQKVRQADFEKPTTWRLLYLPPGEEFCSRVDDEEDEERGEENLLLFFQRRLTIAGRPFFRRIEKIQGDTLEGFYKIIGIVDYTGMGLALAQTWFTEYSVPAKLGEADVFLQPLEQCTFCGLDCEHEDSPSFHNKATCPYKKIWSGGLAPARKGKKKGRRSGASRSRGRL